MLWRSQKTLGFVFSALAVLAAPAVAQDALVLGGGGARGLAHAGSLQALSAKGFRPDLIVGSSMGSIIGALHAAGLDADSIWQIARGLDWQELFSYRRFRSLPDGEAPRPFLNLGVEVDRRRYVEGLMTDWRINRLLVRLLFDAGARARGDFDQLPIPYRAVAGDLKTGGAVSIGSGDLALAVRASMAVPGLFAPILDEQGRYLVDGGIADYLPVQAAREAGARHVVAIDVIDPPAGRMGRLNPMQVALRSFRLTLRNARPDGPPADVLIEPDIDPDLSAAVFLRDARPLLDAGRRAVLEQFPDSLPWPMTGAPMRAPASPPARFAELRTETNDSSLATLVERAFGALRGAPYDADAVLAAVDRLYATGFFTGIWPRIGPGDVLVVRAVAGPPLLASFSLGYDDDRGPRFLAGLRARGGGTEYSLAGRLGTLRSWVDLSARRPLRVAPTLATTAGIAFRDTDVRRFDGERVAGETEVRRAGAWAGVVWTGTDDRAELVAALREDRIVADSGSEGNAWGVSLRIAAREPNARIVGTPLVIEAERRWGDIDWSALRVRGSLDARAGRLQAAIRGDVEAVGSAAPLDDRPALGQPDGMPGLRAGSRLAPVRAIAGLDLAYPIPLEGHVRVRLRAGSDVARFDDLGSSRWSPGAGLDLLWWTPWGRLDLGIGAMRHGGWRATIDLGPRF